MKKYERLGFTSIVADEKLKIEIPIDNLIIAFNNNPDNLYESRVKDDKQREFVEFIAEYILEECDPYTGGTPITEALDKVFELLLEGYEDGNNFIDWKEELI